MLFVGWETKAGHCLDAASLLCLTCKFLCSTASPFSVPTSDALCCGTTHSRSWLVVVVVFVEVKLFLLRCDERRGVLGTLQGGWIGCGRLVKKALDWSMIVGSIDHPNSPLQQSGRRRSASACLPACLPERSRACRWTDGAWGARHSFFLSLSLFFSFFLSFCYRMKFSFLLKSQKKMVDGPISTRGTDNLPDIFRFVLIIQ